MSVSLASQWLKEAEALDSYRSKCLKDPVNAAARRSCSYTVWPDQSIAKGLQEKGYGSKLVIVHPSCEGGMPHTRAGGVVCLPAYWPEQKLQTTLRHEMIHLWQRDNPEEWKAKATREGWVSVPEEAVKRELSEEWMSLCRLNPDTCSSRWWAWKGYYIPLPLFTRRDSPELHDISVRWFDRTSGRVLSSPPTSYIKAYGNVPPSSMEHPFELWAYQMEKPSL